MLDQGDALPQQRPAVATPRDIPRNLKVESELRFEIEFHMLLPTTLLTADQQKKWDAMVVALGAQIAETSHQWAFHGTTVDAANKIAREGFQLSWVRTKTGGGYGVYWGSIETAAYFATNKSIERQEMPAIIAVEISNLISAGELNPDYYMWETGSGTSDLDDPALPPPGDWRESIEEICAFTILGGQ